MAPPLYPSPGSQIPLFSLLPFIINPQAVSTQPRAFHFRSSTSPNFILLYEVMDCAFVAPGQHVYTVDVHYQPNEHGHLATEFETSTLLTPAQSIASSIDVQHFSPSASSTASSSQSTHCRCLIDISTPATLERDFYAWLQVINIAMMTFFTCYY